MPGVRWISRNIIVGKEVTLGLAPSYQFLTMSKSKNETALCGVTRRARAVMIWTVDLRNGIFRLYESMECKW